MKYRSHFFGRLLLPAVALISFSVTAQAADQIWSGSINGSWGTAGNWNGVAVPGAVSGVGSGDTATFNNAVNTAVAVDTYRNIKNLTFDTGAGAFTFSAGQLVLTNAGAITINGGVINTQTINTNILLSTTASSTYSFINNSTTAGAKLNFGGTITGQAVQTLTLGGANGGTISGVIGNGTGTVSVTKLGTGTWTLAAANTYTGATKVEGGGTLNLDFSAATAPTSNIISSFSALTLGGTTGGGRLTLTGKDSTANTQTFASLALGAGANKISLAPGATGGTVGMTITAAHAALSNTAHASLQFSSTGTTTYTNTASLNQFVNGQFNYYATYGTDSWARITANVVGAIAGNDVTTDFTAGGDNNVTASFTTPTGVDPNSIRFASASNLTVTQNNTSFFTGGIMVASTAGTSAINGTGTIRPFGSSNVATDFHIIQNSVNDFTVGNAILNNSSSRPMSLVKSGVGKLILNGANAYSGGTYINEGSVQVGNGSTTGALGTGGVVNFGSLIFNRSNDFTDSNAISGPGSVTKEGAGALVKNSASTYTGATTINAGILEVGNATALSTSAVAVNSGELALNSGLTLANNIAVNGGTLSANNGASTYSGTVVIGASGMTVGARNWWQTGTAQNVSFTNTISGAGALTKSGGGDLTLSVANTHAGGTTISAGKIIANTSSALGSGTLSIASGATLSSGSFNLGVGATTLTGGANILLSGTASTITSSGALSITGSGNLLTVGGTAATAGNTYTLLSGTSLSAAGISITGSAVAGVTIALGDTVTVGRTNYEFLFTATQLKLDVTGGAFNLTWNGGDAAWSATNAWLRDVLLTNQTFFTGDNVTISTGNSITVDGGGVTAGTLAVNNSTGTSALSGGSIGATSFTKSGAGTLQLDNALNISGGVTLMGGSITGSGILTSNTSAFDMRDGSVSAVLNGGVGLTKTTAGSVTLSGVNTFTGPTAVNAGTLAISGSGTLGNGSALTMGGGTLDLGGTSKTVGAVSITTAATSGNTIENGSLTGTSYAASNATGNAIVTANLLANGAIGLTKTGAGTLTLKGTNTYTGTTTVKEGSLVLDGGNNRLLNTGSVVLGDASTTGKLVLGGTTVANQTLTSLTTTGLGGSVGGGNTSNSALTLDLAGNATFAGTLGGAGTNENNLALVKTGAGTLTLSAANSYSGGTTVNAGILTLGNGAAAGSGAVTLTDTTRLNFSTGNSGGATIFTGTNVIIAGTNANATVSSSNSASGWSGSVTGSADQTLIISAVGGQQVNMSGTSKQLQNFYGTVDVTGTVRFSSNLLGAGGNSNGSDNALFNVTGFMSTRNEGAISLGALSGNGTISGGGNLDVNNPSGNTFTVGARGTNADFSGIIQNGSANVVSVVKTGGGSQTFSGATNTYTGATTVNAGTLLVSGSIGNSAVTVNNTNTILASGTTGTIGSTVTVNSAAILAAGNRNAAGTATVNGATTMNNGSIFSWDISSTGTSYDKLVTTAIAGEVTAGDAVFQIVAADANFSDSFWNTTRTWTDVITTDGAAAISNWANLFSVSVVNSSFNSITPVNGSFTLTGSTLTWSAVPEPSSALAGLLLAGSLLRRRRA